MESTKLLTENLALARTIATMGPEIEHLRAEVASHQKLLSEKSSLQRMLNAAQVDLETEKRATQRLQAREEARKARDNEEGSQLQSLQSELAEERRERQEAGRRLQKAESDLEDRKAVFESRLDGLKSKLKAAKDELKETQAELQKTRSNIKASVEATDVSVARVRVQNSRKRSFAQADESTIGTPGIQPVKRNKRASSVVGDKSLFSMTPFLNKTTNLAPTSPHSPTVTQNTESHAPANDPKAKTKHQMSNNATTQANLSANLKETNPTETLKCLPMSKAKRNTTRPTAKRVPVLEQVLENEEEDKNEAEEKAAPRRGKQEKSKQPLQEVVNESKPALMESLFAKKKQKVLGKGLGQTLFDDDVEPSLRGSQPFAKARPLGKKAFVFGSGIGGTAAGGFSFSPLKKDWQRLGAVPEV